MGEEDTNAPSTKVRNRISYDRAARWTQLVLLGICACIMASLSRTDAGLPSFGLVLAIVGGLLMAYPALDWLTTQRFLPDEGGIRVFAPGRHRYIPFENVASVDMIHPIAGTRQQLVVRDDSGRAVFRKRRMNARDMDTSADLFVHLDRWQKARAEGRAGAATFPRNGISIDDWLRELARPATTAQRAYRHKAHTVNELWNIFRTPTARVEDRAAAAWLLLHAGDAPARARVIRSLDATTPPLVVAVVDAACNRGDVHAALVEEASKFLSREVRTAIAKLGGAKTRAPVRVQETGNRVRVGDVEEAVLAAADSEEESAERRMG